VAAAHCGGMRDEESDEGRGTRDEILKLKSETRNKFKALNPESQIYHVTEVWNIIHSNFGFVSDLFRICFGFVSDLFRI
jgi:hypothetical protein